MLSRPSAWVRLIVASGVWLLVMFSIGGVPAALQPAGRIVAIGDIHGDYDALLAILRETGLIDARQRWTGGTTTLVQTGDFLDRGPDVRAVMDLLMRLQRDARARGGRVEVLLGNHEVMNMLGELRDVSPDAYAAFAGGRSTARLARAYQDHVRLAARAALPDENGVEAAPLTEEEWLTTRPPGYLEYRDALSSSGRYGRWLRSLPVMARIDDIVFMHAGIHPELAEVTLEDINVTVKRELEGFDRIHRYLIEQDLIAPSFTLSEMVAAAQAAIGTGGADVDPEAAATGRDGPQDQFRQQVLRSLLGIGGSWLLHPDGPLWYRGFAHWSPEEAAIHLPRLLGALGIERFVVGHTIPPSMRITSRMDGRIFLIDTGLSSVYRGGRASALEIQGGTFTAVYLDGRERLLERPAFQIERSPA